LIPLLIILSVTTVPVLGVSSLRPSGVTRRIAATAARLLASLVTILTEARKKLSERAKLRLAAALLDLGNHLMLCDEERRGRRVRGCAGRALRGGRDPVRALRRFGGSWTDEVTFEVPIGSRPQEGNPARTLHLSCAVSRPPDDGLLGGVRGEADGGAVVAWRVTNRPSEGGVGPISYSEVPDLERALISYHAPAIAPAAGGRFFDEGVHDGGGDDAAKPAA
jgi:hypothetical protein